MVLPPAKSTLSLLALALPVLFPATALAGGFYVPEVGGRAVGMSGAQVSNVDDTTALFHNVAGIAGPKGTQVQVHGLGVLAQVDFFRRPAVEGQTGDTIRFDPVRNTNKFGVVPFLGVTSDVGVDNLGIGVSVSIPFGAHLVFPDDGAQRYVVSEVDFKTIYVTPSVAYKLWDRLSIGVGLSYVYGAIDLSQGNAFHTVLGDPEYDLDPDPETEGTNHLSGHDLASFSANVGLMYTDPDNRFGFGFSLMTPTKLQFDGEATIENGFIQEIVNDDGDVVLEEGTRTDNFTLDYPLPMILRAGMHVRPIDHLMIAFDLNWQRWETFKELYVDFEDNPPLFQSQSTFLADIVIPQEWSNTLSARVGIEAQPKLDLPLFIRAGTLFDQSPIDDRYFDVLAPDSDKWAISGGVGYRPKFGDKVEMTFDLGYMHLFFAERDIKPVKVGPDELSGNDNDEGTVNDTAENNWQEEIPGSDKTIVNKPAPSYYHGITRAAFNLLSVSVAARF